MRTFRLHSKEQPQLAADRRYGIALVWLFMLCVFVSGVAARSDVLTNYTTSWLGNSNPGTPFTMPLSGGMGPVGAHGVNWYTDVAVTPNGTVIGTSYWDEGAKYCPITSSTGQDMGELCRADRMGRFDGGAITANNTFAWVTYQDQNSVPGYVGRFTLVSQTSPSTPAYCYYGSEAQLSANTIYGLAINAAGTELYVSDTTGNLIKVVDPATMSVLRSFSVTSPGQLALDASGNIWVLQHGANIISCYSTAGTKYTAQLTLASDMNPQDIAINTTSSTLLVADAGWRMQILKYDISNVNTTPTSAGAIGNSGGIHSGTNGAVSPLKFNCPQCVSVDSSGNVTVACNGRVAGTPPNGMGDGFGSELLSFNSSNTLRWKMYGLEFQDNASVDPSSETDVYTKQEHFTMDYSKPVGQEWTYKGYTLDSVAYPNDPRLHYKTYGATMVRINGTLFMAVHSGESSPFVLYRFDATSHGETAIPCVMFSAQNVGSWLPNQPASGGWIWTDNNGNGQFDAGEFQASDFVNIYGDMFNISANGDVYYAAADSSNAEICWPYQGLDSHGSPIYTDATRTPMSRPTDMTYVHRIQYDSVNDIMYLAGFSSDYPGNNWQGFHMIRAYRGWKTLGNRTSNWTIACPFQRGSDNNTQFDLGKAFCVSGDYLFYVMLSEGEDPTIPNGTVFVYRISDGSPVGMLQPTNPVNLNTWMDINTAVKAYKRSNGEYLVFVEDDANAKIGMYRWTPSPVTMYSTNFSSFANNSPLTASATPFNGTTLTLPSEVDSDTTAYKATVLNSLNGLTKPAVLTASDANYIKPMLQFQNLNVTHGTVSIDFDAAIDSFTSSYVTLAVWVYGTKPDGTSGGYALSFNGNGGSAATTISGQAGVTLISNPSWTIAQKSHYIISVNLDNGGTLAFTKDGTTYTATSLPALTSIDHVAFTNSNCICASGPVRIALANIKVTKQ